MEREGESQEGLWRVGQKDPSSIMGIGIGIDSRRILISDKGPHDSPPVSDEKSEKPKKERKRKGGDIIQVKVTEEKTREKGGGGGKGETRPSCYASWGE